MPGGKYDSSKTRVTPVFDALRLQKSEWIKRLLALPTGGCGSATDTSIDLRLKVGHWSSKHLKEKPLDPPVALLSWLIRHGEFLLPQKKEDLRTRARLREGDPETIEQAIRLLRTGALQRAWHIFEGSTYPDVYLETPDALIVVEGKRTESAPTTKTTWLEGRHQIWRHIDAAWEIRGRRKVYGFFIVEGGWTADDHEPPKLWKEASKECLEVDALRSSFPHRSAQETSEITQCFLGVTTWQKVCATFGIDYSALPDDVSGIDRQQPEAGEPAE